MEVLTIAVACTFQGHEVVLSGQVLENDSSVIMLARLTNHVLSEYSSRDCLSIRSYKRSP